MSRTRKKPYSGSKKLDKTCRNHGGCNHCRDSRTYQERKAKEAAEQQKKEDV